MSFVLFLFLSLYGGVSESKIWLREKRARTSGESEMNLPSFPRLLLIFLDIVAISVLVHLNRIGVIGGLGYLIGLLGIVILFAFLIKLAKEDKEKDQRSE